MIAEVLEFEELRVRRAILDAIAEGEAYLLTIHDRLRWSRRFRVEELPRFFDQMKALEDEGLVRSRIVGPDAAKKLDRPRRVYTLTAAGIVERRRLGVQ